MIATWIKNKPLGLTVFILFILFLLYKQLPSKNSNAVHVEVAKVHQANIAPEFDAVGNISATNSVNIKPQVSGQLIKIPVQPGQEVKQNDLLCVIDPRTFQAGVDQAKANLLKDQALAKNAANDFQRYIKLLKKGYISHEYFDQVKSNAESTKATVEADQAALKTAQLQLEYTQIRAPIAGRLSDILPKEGDVVNPTDANPITTINQFKPIDASFSLPGENLPSVLQGQKEGTLTVSVNPDNDKSYHDQGKITFIDNQINQSTGTVAMRATFPNEQERLWPGQFVRVSVNLPSVPNALMIPTIAIQQDQQQKYFVYVVDAKNHAHKKSVSLGPTQKDETNIRTGLALGDKVVTKGQFEITDGSKVTYG